MAISRELSPKDVPSLQRRGSQNYITQADYIEFDGVKVTENLLLVLVRSHLLLKLIQKFQVVTPSGNVLVEDLTLKVESGSNLLITGI